ncbi:ATP-binding protein [Streptomyces griseofuscus]|uniref:ATP-binding protein n=1 Tax=Streptomyces griseofuscus TaxID=146922 RepID=UPI001FD086F6|nr:ATP-binding protein [Streptomyces griseofuscus]
MEALIDLVFSAVGTVASGALSGAGGETGRRISERLHGLLGRAGSEPGTPAGQQVLILPVTEHERRAAAFRLVQLAHSSPEFAREVREWVREASWLAPRPVTAVAPGASRPQMLPPATAAFTDREDVLAWIKGLLDDADPAPGAPLVATLTGPGGIGKTATVVRCAHELRERFPDGVLFVDLAGASAGTALTPSEALVRLLEGLKAGTVPGDEARQRDLFRDCTADRRMIVVLDNALDDAQVLPLLPAAPGSLVLVSSRHRLGRLVAEHGAHPFTLRPRTPSCCCAASPGTTGPPPRRRSSGPSRRAPAASRSRSAPPAPDSPSGNTSPGTGWRADSPTGSTARGRQEPSWVTPTRMPPPTPSGSPRTCRTANSTPSAPRSTARWRSGPGRP